MADFPSGSRRSLTAVRQTGGVYVTAPWEPCRAPVCDCVCEVQLSGKRGSWLFSPGEIQSAAAVSVERKEAEKRGVGEEHEAVAARGVYRRTDTITDGTKYEKA